MGKFSFVQVICAVTLLCTFWRLDSDPKTWTGPRSSFFVSLFGAEGTWLLYYFWAGFWIGVGILSTLSGLPKRKGTKNNDAIPIIIVFWVVYLCQVTGYIFLKHSHFHWMLTIPVLLFAVYAFRFQHAQKTENAACRVCGGMARFILVKDTKPSVKRVKYCRTHFLDALKKHLEKYDGFFVIQSPRFDTDIDSAQYIFYKPDDMAQDNYSASDISMVETVIDKAASKIAGNTDKYICARIPGDIVRNLDSPDDTQMFTRDIAVEDMTPMTLNDLAAFLDSVLQRFDEADGKFSMNVPYSQRGIYIWQNYL